MNEPQGKVAAVCVSEGGIPRLPVASARLTIGGIPGDGHRFEEHYQRGRAITLFNLELLEKFTEGAAPFPPGSAGENVTVRGFALENLFPDDRLYIGEAEIQLEKIWKPCHAKNAETGAMQANTALHAGFFASVIREGTIRPGDPIAVVR